ncbi:MAG: helix-turn-helix domain-containing protein [Spirochaetes bacterium]|nr:helix-turn-helix domain-containing protein [Spirochaetota bacterium]
MEEKLLVIHVDTEKDNAFKVLNALASNIRLDILDLIKDKKLNVSEIAKELCIPQSTVSTNLKFLEEAKLIKVEIASGKKGAQKLCSHRYEEIVFQLPGMERKPQENIIEVEMPVGLYTDYKVSPPCGLCSTEKIIGYLDVPKSFFEPARATASLIWFERGFVEYKFPNNLPVDRKPKKIEISMELSSEVVGTNKDWPSDITLWIDGVEIGTWTSPGDYGDKRGKLTPEWWKLAGSQYGMLKKWSVTETGSLVDGINVSGVKINDLGIRSHTSIKVKIGIKEDAKNVGGINIFGSSFGNYAQDIIMRLELE